MLWNIFINDFKLIMKKLKEKSLNSLREHSKKTRDIYEKNSKDKEMKNLLSLFQCIRR